MTTLGAQLKNCREAQGLNQTQAAAHFGVARTAYRLWEMGAATPSPKHWRAIAQMCNVPLASILREQGLINEEEEQQLLALRSKDGVSGILPKPASDLADRSTG